MVYTYIQLDLNKETVVLIGSMNNCLPGMALLLTTGSVQFAAQKMTAT